MKTIKKFDEFINEELLFRKGGDIGGEHKNPVSDEDIESGKAYKKGYKPQPKGLTHDAIMIDQEKTRERKINLMGSTLEERISGNTIKEFIDRLIESVNLYLKEPGKYWGDSIVSYLKILPKEIIEHFDIDLNSDNVAEDFIQNNYELFKRSYDMFKEIKDYPVRYGVS